MKITIRYPKFKTSVNKMLKLLQNGYKIRIDTSYWEVFGDVKQEEDKKKDSKRRK